MSLHAIASAIGRGTIDLAALPTFASKWLVPRLSDFYAKHSGILINRHSRIGQFDLTEKRFMDLGAIASTFKHDLAYLNVIRQGDTVVVEGTSHGTSKGGADWRAGVTQAGRWCDVFEIRDFKIQRCFIYLDPAYEDADTGRYPWLAGGR